MVQCYNHSPDWPVIQWECKTEMPVGFKFGKTQVLCEGYDSTDDPYILAGSCRLEYTIDRTSMSQKKSDYLGAMPDEYVSDESNDGKPYKGIYLSKVCCLLFYYTLKAIKNTNRT